MDAIRVARGITGREKIVKVEGGYHGHHDEVMISMKPPISEAGPADAPRAIPATAGITRAVLADTKVVPYNRPDLLEAALKDRDVACFIVEPVMENIGICMPQPGYLQAVREITRKYGTMLIFDEVKTGITAGWGGATGAVGVTPDLVALAEALAATGRQADFDTVRALIGPDVFDENPLLGAAVALQRGAPEAGQSLLSTVEVDELDEWRLSLWAKLMDRTGRTEVATETLRQMGVEAAAEAQPERVTVEPRMIRRPRRLARSRLKRPPAPAAIRGKQVPAPQQQSPFSTFGQGSN